MKVTYQNRGGDDITFEKIDDNTIKMSGFIYYRIGYKDNVVDFIDPAGGPYIQIGTDVGRYFINHPRMIVKSIESSDGILLKI